MNKETIEEPKLTWFQIHDRVSIAIKGLPKQVIHDAILEIFPLNEGQEYIGSLANHYRGRLRHEGIDSLFNQMCSYSLTQFLTWLTANKTNNK